VHYAYGSPIVVWCTGVRLGSVGLWVGLGRWKMTHGQLCVILQKFLHHLLLSVDWHSGKTVIGRCHTPSFPLWLSIMFQPPHHRRMWRGCFPFAGTCAPENGTGQVPTLSSVGYISQNEKKLFGLNGCLTENETWKQTQTVLKTLFCLFCINFCTAMNSTRNWQQF